MFQIVDVATCSALHKFSAPFVSSVAFSSDDRHLLIGTHHGQLYTFDIWTGSKREFDTSVGLHKADRIFNVRSSPDDSAVASISLNSVCLWDYATRALIMLWNTEDLGLGLNVSCTFAFTSSEKRLLAGWSITKDLIKVWDVTAFSTVPAPVTDGSAVEQVAERTHQWRQSREEIFEISAGNSRRVSETSFSHDGRLLLLGFASQSHWDTTVEIWDLALKILVWKTSATDWNCGALRWPFLSNLQRSADLFDRICPRFRHVLHMHKMVGRYQVV